MISRMERGHLADHTLKAIRAVSAALDMRIDLVPRWRGGDLDRLVNAGHARLHDDLALYFRGLGGWVALPEVSFSIFGERGVIDILAWHASQRALLVVELKTDITDINELMGVLDRKRRLATRIGRERGWQPTIVGSWVVVSESRTNRRRVEAHDGVRAAFPLDGRSMVRWLRKPDVPIAGLSFWSSATGGHVRRPVAPVRRVRKKHQSGS